MSRHENVLARLGHGLIESSSSSSSCCLCGRVRKGGCSVIVMIQMDGGNQLTGCCSNSVFKVKMLACKIREGGWSRDCPFSHDSGQ